MKRQTVIRHLVSFTQKDVVIFCGSGLCKEAFKYDVPGNFYLDDKEGLGFSLALGVSMGTDKRIYIVCEDNYLLQEMSMLVQLASSKRKNIFLIVLSNGTYQDTGFQPNIFKDISAIKGMLFNLGFSVSDFTNTFNLPGGPASVKNSLTNSKGPMAAVMYIDKGVNKKVKDLKVPYFNLFKEMNSFLMGEKHGV